MVLFVFVFVLFFSVVCFLYLSFKIAEEILYVILSSTELLTAGFICTYGINSFFRMQFN